MSEPKHSNVLLGKSIREIRLRRGLTQRELSEAICGISESALRCYELGERRPKLDTLERIAKALDVAPACFDTYGIEHYDELMHTLFLSEEPLLGMWSLTAHTFKVEIARESIIIFWKRCSVLMHMSASVKLQRLQY